MGYLKELSDHLKGSLIIFILNELYLVNLPKSLLKQPKDFFFWGTNNSNIQMWCFYCEIHKCSTQTSYLNTLRVYSDVLRMF